MSPADIITDLLQRVNALEQKVGLPSEALQPTYLTIKPDGTVGANFTGRVHAQGLNLDAGTNSTPPDQDRVRWLRTTDSATTAAIYGYTAGNLSHVILSALGVQGGPTDSEAHLIAESADGTALSILTMEANDGAVGQAAVSVVNQFRQLLDQNGASDFLALASTQKLQLVLGNAQITAGAGVAFSVAHGLGRAPTVAFAIPLGWAGFVYNSGAPDATNLSLAANVALVNNFIYWLAIG